MLPNIMSLSSVIELFVECSFLYPCCAGFKRLLCSRKAVDWATTSFSRILPGVGRRAIGRNSPGLVAFGTFAKGRMRDNFQLGGISPVEIEWL